MSPVLRADRVALLAALALLLPACGSRSGLAGEADDTDTGADATTDSGLDTLPDSNADADTRTDTALPDTAPDTDPSTVDTAPDVAEGDWLEVDVRPPVGAGITALRPTPEGLYATTANGLWRLDAIDTWWTRLGSVPNAGDRLYVYDGTYWVHQYGSAAWSTRDPDGAWTQMSVSEMGCLAPGDDTLYNISGGEPVPGGVTGPVTRRWNRETASWESILGDDVHCVEAGGETAAVIGDRLVRVRAGEVHRVWVADDAWRPVEDVPESLSLEFPLLLRPAVVDATSIWITAELNEPFSFGLYRSDDGEAWEVFERPDDFNRLDLQTSIVPFEDRVWVARGERDAPVVALDDGGWEVVDTDVLGEATADRELAVWQSWLFLADNYGISTRAGATEWMTIGYGLYEPDAVAANDALFVQRGHRVYHQTDDGRWAYATLDAQRTIAALYATGPYVVALEQPGATSVLVSDDGGERFERVDLSERFSAGRPRVQGVDAEQVFVELDDVLWSVPLDGGTPQRLAEGLPLDLIVYRVGDGASIATPVNTDTVFLMVHGDDTWRGAELALDPDHYATRVVMHGSDAWLLTQPQTGPVFHSDDAGFSWTEDEAILGASHLVSWGDALVAVVPGVDGASVHRRVDGTWEHFADVSDTIVDAVATPERLTLVTATSGWRSWER